jgi:hypothetical protein
MTLPTPWDNPGLITGAGADPRAEAKS